MIVVADTSPIRYLLLLGHIDLLPQLYGQIVIPIGVQGELIAPKAPRTVQLWASHLPNWVDVRASPIGSDPALARLDLGEQEAILLAQELRASLLLLDDKAARQAARLRNLPVTGLLGVLDEAANGGLVNRRRIVQRLLKTNFRIAPAMLASFLEGSF